MNQEHTTWLRGLDNMRVHLFSMSPSEKKDIFTRAEQAKEKYLPIL
jgi:hypothetical protein